MPNVTERLHVGLNGRVEIVVRICEETGFTRLQGGGVAEEKGDDSRGYAVHFRGANFASVLADIIITTEAFRDDGHAIECAAGLEGSGWDMDLVEARF
jgi:hypothetical protein